MDSYKEQIIKVKPTLSTYFSKALIWLLALAIAFVSFYFAIHSGLTFIMLLSAAVIYAAYKVNCSLNIEFEYIATNGSVDVDKIINKSSRKRIVSFDCAKVEMVEKTDSFKQKLPGVKTFICTDNLESAYIFTVPTKEFGKCRVVFSPNEEFIKHIKMFVPRSLISEWWK